MFKEVIVRSIKRHIAIYPVIILSSEKDFQPLWTVPDQSEKAKDRKDAYVRKCDAWARAPPHRRDYDYIDYISNIRLSFHYYERYALPASSISN